jgi:hypothetical protein
MSILMILREKLSKLKVHVYKINLISHILRGSILKSSGEILIIRDLRLSSKVSNKGKIKS